MSKTVFPVLKREGNRRHPHFNPTPEQQLGSNPERLARPGRSKRKLRTKKKADRARTKKAEAESVI